MVYIPGLGSSSFPGGLAGVPGSDGAAGAQGPAGAAGPTGPTGPAGTNAQLGGAGYYSEFDDFIHSSAALAGWLTSTSSGTIIKTQTGITAADKACGVLSLPTGVSSSGFASILKDSEFVIGGFATFDQEWRIQIPSLSNIGQRFVIRIGLADDSSPIDGVYFEYQESSSANWRCITSSNSSQTIAASGVAVAAATFIKLRIVFSPTEANFYINGTLVATTTTNLPTADGRSFGVRAGIVKTIGSTERVLNLDYHKLTIDWTVDR